MAKGRSKVGGRGTSQLRSAERLARQVEKWPGVDKVFRNPITRAGKEPDLAVRPGPNDSCLAVNVYEGPSKVEIIVYATDLELIKDRFARMGRSIATP